MFVNRSVALIVAALAWLVATLAIAPATHWPWLAVLPLTLLFCLLVGAVSLSIASGSTRSRAGVAGRCAVAVLVGVVVGELAALVMFSGSIDRRLDEQAARIANSTPVVAQASANLDRMRDARVSLDDAVDEARIQRDQALVVARCEYNPSPACPHTRITGVPGFGPETRTANELLTDTQRELDTAIQTRDRRAPGLDAEIASAEEALAQARQAAMSDADRSLGARWVAMHEDMLASTGALVLWAVTIAFFALLSLLPLILKLLRGNTTREHADLDADTAISVKRAEVRAAIENMWAEQQLDSARLAVDAQNEIDRELHRRRVVEALDAPVHATLDRPSEPVEEDAYLPIAAEAEAASRAAAVPARVDDDRERSAPLIPTMTKTAARWIRPLVPPVIARAIDSTSQPLRSARQVFEEVEEITFSFKRTHKVTVRSEETGSVAGPTGGTARIEPSTAAEEHGFLSVDSANHPELERWDGSVEMRGSNPRELPPAE